MLKLWVFDFAVWVMMRPRRLALDTDCSSQITGTYYLLSNAFYVILMFG